MGGRCGDCNCAACARGLLGLECEVGLLDWERPRALGPATDGGGGDIEREAVDMRGAGAWICIDMARVGRAR